MYFSLFTSSQNKTNRNRDCELARHTQKCHHTTLWNATHSSDGRYIISLQTLVALKTADCVVLYGNLNVSQRQSKCSKWPPSAWIHDSSFYSAPQCSHCKRCTTTSYSNSVCLSVSPSVRLSVTRRYCVKTTSRSTVQFALSDSKMCLVM